MKNTAIHAGVCRTTTNNRESRLKMFVDGFCERLPIVQYWMDFQFPSSAIHTMQDDTDPFLQIHDHHTIKAQKKTAFQAIGLDQAASHPITKGHDASILRIRGSRLKRNQKMIECEYVRSFRNSVKSFMQL